MGPVVEQAEADHARFYDDRYERGYMRDFADLYEACRVVTIKDTLRQLPTAPARVLDCGCGEGRYLGVVREHFAQARLVGCDVSRVALDHARRLHPDAEYVSMDDERVPLADASFELVLSVEVLEHVADVEAAARELARLLAPGGRLVMTTPCANPGSLEWLLNRRRGGLQQTADGYGRFATDEPGHLRRLTSRDVRVLLQRAGLAIERIDYRAHLFASLMMRTPGWLKRILGRRTVRWLALLDWRLLRRLPNGATMVVVARRTGGAR